MFKTSIASYPQRGSYGKNDYFGNCTGYIIQDFLDYTNADTTTLFCDPSVGGGTSADVAKERNIPFAGYDLHSGFNLLKDDLGKKLNQDHGRLADNIFWHPPYNNMIAYSGNVWGKTPHPDDLSNCTSLNDFLSKLQLALMNIYDALKHGGHYAVLMGNMRRKGTYTALAAMLQQLCPGKLREELIKVQHNAATQFKTYTAPQKWVPIAHEVLYIYQKDQMVFAMQTGLWLVEQLKHVEQMTWKNVIKRVLMQAGKALTLQEIYAAVQKCTLVANNQNWQAKVRQKLQDPKIFSRVQRGVFELATI